MCFYVLSIVQGWNVCWVIPNSMQVGGVVGLVVRRRVSQPRVGDPSQHQRVRHVATARLPRRSQSTRVQAEAAQPASVVLDLVWCGLMLLARCWLYISPVVYENNSLTCMVQLKPGYCME